MSRKPALAVVALVAMLSHVAAAPLAPQGGTITSVTSQTGGGLVGGAFGGPVVMSLIRTCAADQVLAWSGTAWACAYGGGFAAGTWKHIPAFTADGHHLGDTPVTYDAGFVELDAPLARMQLGLGAAAGPPIASTTAVDSGAGLLSAGDYRWRYYEEDGNGSTTMSPVSNTLTLAASHKATVTIGLPRPGVGARDVCRNKAGGSTYYLVHTFGGGFQFFSTIWVDNIPDSSLVTLCPTVDTTKIYAFDIENGVKTVRTPPGLDMITTQHDLTVITSDPSNSGSYGVDSYGPVVARTYAGVSFEGIKTGSTGSTLIDLFWTSDTDSGAGLNPSGALTEVWAVGGHGSTIIQPDLLNETGTTRDTRGLTVLATLPAVTTTAHSGVLLEITSAGSSSNIQTAVSAQLDAGYTGSSNTIGFSAANGTATTGTAFGLVASATGTAAQNVGSQGKAANGTRNFGLYGGFGDAPTGATGGRDAAIWADNQATHNSLFLGTDSRTGHVVTFEATGDGGVFGGALGMYMSADGALGCQGGTNGSANCYINYYGYAPLNVPGNTQFRNLLIADGKGATIATITGSTKAADFAGALDGLTVATGGPSGSKWSKGTGAPGISCSIGDLFSRTDGGVGTSFYLCTASNTWTADGTSGSTGTVTSVATSSGITGGTITTTGTIGYDSAVIQSRVGSTCAAPNAIRAIASDGTVTCTTGTGSVTSVATGTGLTGGTITSTGTISLNINAGSTQTCGAGTAVTALTGVGITSCAAFGSSSLTNSAGNNVIPKSNGTNLVASSLSDDATTVSTTEAVSVGTATGKGKFSVLSGNPGASGGTVIANGVWDTNYTIVGPNVASTTGAALAFAYSSTDSASKIMSLAPGNAWERMDFLGSQFNWYINNSLKMTFDGTTLALTGAETVSSTLNVTGQISGSASLAITGFVSWTTQLADGGTVFTLASGTTTNTKGVTSGTFTSSGTTETITFGGGFTFSSTPSCVVTSQSVAGKAFAYAVSTTAITLSSLTTATKYDFACRGHQ